MFAPKNRRRVQVDCGDEMLTKQAFKDECDIHQILERYQRTGQLTHLASQQGQFLDLPASVDLQEAYALAQRAGEAFDALPAAVRDRFDNSAINLLAALEDPGMVDELRELGILVKPPASGEKPEGDGSTAKGPAVS